ncbi:MAG TPA: D-glycero-beta-D-manno-heptose 1-phosphate adenylyltransferase [Chitinophagaceae bacterium]|nr:D-glycero-beta-D-manno-heptose 1-phosphate adenylyltransferase [Chitinophagaceae bacterium]
MRNVDSIRKKIFDLPALVWYVNQLRFLQKKIVFTNGCFDILHEGHIYSLSQAAASGDVLIIGVNSDASVKRLKGDSRPVNNEHSRSLILASLTIVDAVVLFNEDTPLELIKTLMPDVLVKGGDYTVEQIAGAKEVMANGGEVKIVPLLEGFSTTGIIKKIIQL